MPGFALARWRANADQNASIGAPATRWHGARNESNTTPAGRHHRWRLRRTVGRAGRCAGRTSTSPLIDRTNHYLFQPLLYQVATGVLSPADIAVPIRFLLRRQRNATVLLADVDAIDLAGQNGAGRRPIVPFDFLIVATGSRHSYFAHPEWEPIAPGLKTLEDARHIRHRFLRAFELAEESSDPAEQQALLTFVIVGGGPTGSSWRVCCRRLPRKDCVPISGESTPRRFACCCSKAGRACCRLFRKRCPHARARISSSSASSAAPTHWSRVSPPMRLYGDERVPTRTVFLGCRQCRIAACPQPRRPGRSGGPGFVEPDLSIPGMPHVSSSATLQQRSISRRAPRHRCRHGGLASLTRLDPQVIRPRVHRAQRRSWRAPCQVRVTRLLRHRAREALPTMFRGWRPRPTRWARMQRE